MRVLLLSYTDGEFAPFLAAHFQAWGLAVDALCPASHVLAFSRFVERCRILPWDRSAAIKSVIQTDKPALVVACDDPARRALSRLHAACVQTTHSASADVAAIIERSLGEPAHFRLAEERSRLLDELAKTGIRMPTSIRVESPRDLERAASTLAFPIILKRDRTWGGQGVVLCADAAALLKGFRHLKQKPTMMGAFRRVVRQKDLSAVSDYLSPPQDAIVAQQYIVGHPANCVSASWKGETLAALTVSVVEARSSFGASSVVRIVESPEIASAVEFITRRLQLSGICGFDFMVESATGQAFFLELNARATPTCHIGRTVGTDVVGALARRCGIPPRPGLADYNAGSNSNEPIAMFPGEWFRDPASPFLESANVAVPWSDPAVLASHIIALATRTRAPRNAIEGFIERAAMRIVQRKLKSPYAPVRGRSL